MASEKKELMKTSTWTVERTAEVHEVSRGDGTIRYHVTVSDEGRRPFISRWFNDPVPAMDLMERIEEGRER